MTTGTTVFPSMAEAQKVSQGTTSNAHELKDVAGAKRSNGAAAVSGAIRGAIGGTVVGGLMLSVPGVTPFFAHSFVITLGVFCAMGTVLMSLMVVVNNMGASE